MSVGESIHKNDVALERIRFALERRVSKTVLKAVSLEQFWDEVHEEMVSRIVYDVLGQKLEERVVEYPADWWQAARQRWLPRWVLRRWPVRLERVQMRLSALYPELPPNQKLVYHVDIGPVVEPDA